MDDPKSFLRSLAAVLFLAVLGAVLARPVFSTNVEPRSEAGLRSRKPSPTSTPPSRPTPTPSLTVIADQPAGIQIERRFPPACLRPTPGPAGAGAIAVADDDGRISIGTPTTSSGSFAGRAPVSWSPSGRYLGYGRGIAYDITTGERGPMLRRKLNEWVWSPRADCVLGLAGRRLVAGPVGAKGVVIASGPITSFRVTDDGRFLVAYPVEGMFEGFDLRRNRSIPRRRVGPIFEGDAPFGCSDVPRPFVLASCAPNDGFGVAIRDPDGGKGSLGRLWLMDREGDPVRPVTSGPYEDTYPEWGPARTGVLFLRRPPETERLEVWYLPEGGNPTRTRLALADVDGLETSNSFIPAAVIDWSATPPRGYTLTSD